MNAKAPHAACRHCGAHHSAHGYSLVEVVHEDGSPACAICVQCCQKHEWHWFPMTGPRIAELVERIPWVPTQQESAWCAWPKPRNEE